MKDYANLIFEARLLKQIPRSGYSFLGLGKENVAEHSFLITFISYILARLNPEADDKKIVFMCLFHDLPEARIGDINYVQKKYVKPDEERAIEDITSKLFFGDEIKSLLAEFNKGETIEAKLARDADQISFLVDLKALKDKGGKTIDDWIKVISERLVTDSGKKLAREILKTSSDEWWLENYVDG